ncbi:MAG: hypothetical protein EBU90_04965 [Proteobacteria bacterium]|nr:hypothetical protein [Pseudomonadota bacterium]
MTEDEDKVLCEKYPKIFKNRNGSIQETCMAWGFECGSGWFDIIDILCHEIQNHVDWKSKDLPEEEKEFFQVVATQVKEKFGTLRFYYGGGDDVVEGMVSMAESMSHRICEECGCPGDPRKGSWIKTLCDKCDDERKTKTGVIRCV